jgi:hypothetical protein
MSIDERCCGSGTCIINSQGECWCGHRWDGEKMCAPLPLQSIEPESNPEATNEKAS